MPHDVYTDTLLNMHTKKINTIDDLTADSCNANKGTDRGRAMLDQSLADLGAGRSVLADVNGKLIAGNKAAAAAKAQGKKVRVVETTGDELVVVQRTDLDLDDVEDRRARQLAYADNRAGELGLSWDAQQVVKDVAAGLDLGGVFSQDALRRLAQAASLNSVPQFPAEAVDKWASAKTFFDKTETAEAALEGKLQIVVQFSGGKDSTAALAWAAKNRSEKQSLTCVFSDPGVEFPGAAAHVAQVAEFFGAELVIVKPKIEWWSRCRENGSWPSIVHRGCATLLIHAPISAWVKSKCDPGLTLVLTGSRAEEAVRGSRKTQNSPLAALPKYAHFAPAFSSTKDVLSEVLAASGAPLWEGYAQGFVRTACWCCPGQCAAQAFALARVYPGLAEYIRKTERTLGPLKPLSVGSRPGGGRSFDDLVRHGQALSDRQARRDADAAQGEGE